jgi:hypothetical protein
MMSAYALCPTDMSHPARMAWMADYFLRKYDARPVAAPSDGEREARPLFDPNSPREGYVSDAEWAARRAAKTDTCEQRLRDVLAVVQEYLPPDGLDAEEAMSRITALVDPMPAASAARSAEIQQLREDAERYRWLRSHGRCDGKHPQGVDIGDRLKSQVSFRYWIEPNALDAAIDKDRFAFKESKQ